MSLKSVAAALGNHISLQQDFHRFRLVDILAAVGGAMSRFTIDPRNKAQAVKGNAALHQTHLVSLGTDLIAFKYGKVDRFGPCAVAALALLLNARFDHPAKMLHKIAILAIGEWTFESCQSCKGTGWMFDFNGVERVCRSCNSGSGRKRYMDTERAEVLEIHPTKLDYYAKAIAQAEQLIALAQTAATDAAKRAHGL
jgi:hypothetical protein